MMKIIISIIRILIALSFLIAIFILGMGYAFEGRVGYISMILVFAYSIYTIFFKNSYQVLNIGIYLLGIGYVSKRLYDIYIDNIFFNEALFDHLVLILSFLILIWISVQNIIQSNKR